MNILAALRRSWFSGLIVGVLLAGSVQAAPVLYSQPPDDAGDLLLSTTALQNADSFTLGYAASITALRWWGVDSDVNRLIVRFYNDFPTATDTFSTQSGLAGAVLTKVATGMTVVSGGTPYPIFQFELTLASAIGTLANHQYYVAIFSSENWGWLSSQSGDGISAFRGSDGNPWLTAPPDLSLAVLGNRVGAAAVPEPASVALLMLGVLALAANRRGRMHPRVRSRSF